MYWGDYMQYALKQVFALDRLEFIEVVGGDLAFYRGYKDGKMHTIELFKDRSIYFDGEYVGKLKNI